MAILHIIECARLGKDANGRTVHAIQEPTLADAQVDFGAGEADSDAFSKETRILWLESDTTCHYEVGTAPTASTSGGKRLIANVQLAIAIDNPNGDLKISVIAA